MREDRITAERAFRRRRQPGTLNRMVATVFGLPPECLDPEYHYHWVNDKMGRVQMLTTQDDYDKVTPDELVETAKRNRADFALDPRMYGEGADISVAVERDGTRAVLLKKPKAFYDHDYEEGVAARQAMMESRIFEGALDNDVEGKTETLSEEHVYVPAGNTLGDAAPRRRGRIPNRLK